MSALEDKQILITGAASGIGRALAEHTIEAGARVTLVDVDHETLERLAQGGAATAVPMSVAELDGWRSLSVPERGWDYVALNAGVMSAPRDAPAEASDFLSITDEQYRRIVGVNLDGVAFGIRETLPGLSAEGAIVATASVAGLVGFGADVAYSMTKHAVVGLVRAMASQLEMQGRSQRVCAICPGGVQTNIVPDFMEGAAEMMDPSVIANEIVSLWTDGANGEIRTKILAGAPAQVVAPPPLPGLDLG